MNLAVFLLNYLPLTNFIPYNFYFISYNFRYISDTTPSHRIVSQKLNLTKSMNILIGLHLLPLLWRFEVFFVLKSQPRGNSFHLLWSHAYTCLPKVCMIYDSTAPFFCRFRASGFTAGSTASTRLSSSKYLPFCLSPLFLLSSFSPVNVPALQVLQCIFMKRSHLPWVTLSVMTEQTVGLPGMTALKTFPFPTWSLSQPWAAVGLCFQDPVQVEDASFSWLEAYIRKLLEDYGEPLTVSVCLFIFTVLRVSWIYIIELLSVCIQMIMNPISLFLLCLSFTHKCSHSRFTDEYSHSEM